MRPTIHIIAHTDFSESNPHGPMLPFRTDSPETWDRIFGDLGARAHVDSIAIGCRGTFDPPAVACLPIVREAYLRASHHPTLTFWADTVGLPDIAHNLSGGGGFDFANPQHIQWAWEHFLNHFVVHFGDLHLTRSPNGKVLILWWGISKNNGWGFVNRQHSQRLLDSVDAHFVALGLGGADHIVDTTWLDDAPTLRVYGVHNWFSGHHNPQSYSTRTHHGVMVGVVVPGFTDPETGIDTIPHSGETARAGLQACMDCHHVICEGATDFQENAYWIRNAAGDDSKLTAISDITAPQTETIEALMHVAVSAEPILKWHTAVLVDSPLGNKRKAMRWTQTSPTSGHPDPASSKFLCLNPDGTTEAKEIIGEWESSQPIETGDNEIRWFTQNAEQTKSACLVYGLQQFA